MQYSVSGAAIASMWVVILLCAALVIAPFLLIKKRYKADGLCFVAGAVVFGFFAIGLETAPKQLILASMMTTGEPNYWLIALVSALLAGIFEETGRYLCFNILMKKRQDNDGNALMYGAGHAGCEVVIVVMLAMINNLTIAGSLNAGNAESLLAGVDEAQQFVLLETFRQLSEAKPAMFMWSVVERIAAVAAHISLSVIVWTGWKKKKPVLFIAAVALHTLLDFVPGVSSLLGVPTALVELETYVCAAICVAAALRTWKTAALGSGFVRSESL